MSLSLLEQETIINYNRAEDSTSVYTHDKKLIGQLERRGFVAVRENVYDGRVVAKSFIVPKDTLRIGFKRRVSSAHRATAVVNLQSAREIKSRTRLASGFSGPTSQNGPTTVKRSVA